MSDQLKVTTGELLKAISKEMRTAVHVLSDPGEKDPGRALAHLLALADRIETLGMSHTE